MKTVRSVTVKNYAHESFVFYKIKGKVIAGTRAPNKETAKEWKEQFMSENGMNLSGGFIKENPNYVPKKGPKKGSHRVRVTA